MLLSGERPDAYGVRSYERASMVIKGYIVTLFYCLKG